ncbi:uncharacterized protein PG986_004238 [Apiospora aurea]|uniref:MARVEL domain-containing protein n=1 Tax=Apiospora aurea TaxID=335848 RepID=A0ABR1QM14_9PEZI
MSAARANHHEPPPPPAPPTSSTMNPTSSSPKPPLPPPPPPPQPQPPSHTPVIMNLPPRESLPDLPQIGTDAAWVIVKSVLRALCLLLGLLLAAFALWTLAHYDPARDDAVIQTLAETALPIGLLAAVWNGAEFATMCARRSRPRRGIPAKAHVALELLLWMLAVAGSVTQAFAGYSMYVTSGDSTVSCFAVLGVLEFGLFVRSCLEVDRRKKDRRIQQLVIALQMQQQQYQLMPQQQQQQQQYNNNIASPLAESTTWGPAAPASTSDYDRELNTKYQGPMPEPLYDPRDLQKVLIIDPRLRGIAT